MEVFRITHKKWSNKLIASGYAARWNSTGFFVIYTAENCSLACLENLVHRNGFGSNIDYCVMTIFIPNSIKISEIKIADLPKKWNKTNEEGHLLCRDIGDKWLQIMGSSVLIVPSAIIPNEKNILINPNHIDFQKIVIQSTTDFSFDSRLLL